MNSPTFTPLGRKLAIAIAGTALVALVLSLALNILPLLHSYRLDAVQRSRTLADLMAASLVAAVDFQDHEAAQEILDLYALVPDVTGAAVYTADGATFASYLRPPDFVAVDTPRVQDSLNELLVLRPVTAGADPAVLAIRFSLTRQWEVLSRYLLVAALILAVVFAVSFRLAKHFRKKLGDPLRELTEVVTKIGKSEDYSQRVDAGGNDEIGLLMTEFNSMLEKIDQRDMELRRHREQLEQLVDQRTLQLKISRLELLRINRDLVGEIRKRTKAEMIREEVERINRHDLKSSLSLVIGYPELLLRNKDLNEEQEKYIKRIRAAGYRMLDMVTNHLDMFKMEKGIYTLKLLPVDLVETVCSLEEEFAPLLNKSKVSLRVLLNGEDVVGNEVFEVAGEGPLLRAMLRNLIQNAIEASNENDTVTVSMECGRKKQIAVSNPTPVPKEVRQRMFERYVTHGKEHGTGLGTYFAALVARTHGANISMSTDNRTGTVMTVTFRDAPSPQQIPAPARTH